MSARNPGKRQTPPDDTIEDPATIAAMNEAAGAQAERVAEMMAGGAVQAPPNPGPEAPEDDRDGDQIEGFDEDLIEDLEDALGEATIDLTSLRGDLRDAMLEQFKRRPKPWDQMTEGQQRDVISALNNGAESLIRKMVHLIASADRVQVAGTLESLTVKDGIKVTLKAPYSIDNLHALGEAQGKQVLIVVADAGSFMGQRREARVDPDQRPLLPEDDGDLVNAADPKTESPFGTASTGPAADVGAQAAADFAADNAGAEGDGQDADPPATEEPAEEAAE